MEMQERKQAVFIDTSDEKHSAMARFINYKGRLVAANCRMKKVTGDQGRNHCFFLTVLARFSLVSLIVFYENQRALKSQTLPATKAQ